MREKINNIHQNKKDIHQQIKEIFIKFPLIKNFLENSEDYGDDSDDSDVPEEQKNNKIVNDALTHGRWPQVLLLTH